MVPLLPPRGGRPVAPGPDPLLRRLISPVYACLAGVVGQLRAPGVACCRRVSLAGGGGGSLCAFLPGDAAGGPSRAAGHLTSVSPPAFLGQATEQVPLASLWVWRAWPSYRSSSCSRVVPGCDLCAALVRRRGFARLSWPPSEQAVGGVRARGVRAQLHPSPGRRGPFGGRGDVPSAQGVGGPVPPWPADQRGEWGERGGGVAPWFPTSLPRGAACRPRLSPPSSPAHSPRGHLFGWGRWAAPGPGRGLAGRCWVRLVGGGGGRCAAPPSGAPLRSLPLLPPPYCLPARCRPAAVYGAPLSAGAGLPACCGHCGSVRAADWRHSACSRACHGCGFPPGCRGPLGGVAGPPPPWSASGCPRAGGGGRGPRGGGFPAPPWSSDAALRRPRGGVPVILVPGGQPPTGGVHSPRAHPHPLGAGRRAAASPRGAGWPGAGGGGRVGGCWGWRLGSVVSG